MYCPACGADAGDAKFCPECGTNLKDLAGPPVCSSCGSEIPEGAKFCPECGAPARGSGGGSRARDVASEESVPAAAQGSAGGRRTGARGKSAGTRQQRRQQSAKAKGQSTAAAKAPGRVSPLVAWGVIVAVVVVAVVVVVFYAAGRGGGSGATASPGASVQPVAADTSGSYSELVQRANGLYDQGAAKYQAKQYAQGAAYYLAASKVYAAAWKQQASDPGVGTDFATSLFYAGKIDAAIAQVDKVLTQAPGFQTAWFNKGNYLAQKASDASTAGNAKAAKVVYAGARAAYQKAIALDPNSSTGQQAKQDLSALPSPSP